MLFSGDFKVGLGWKNVFMGVLKKSLKLSPIFAKYFQQFPKYFLAPNLSLVDAVDGVGVGFGTPCF